jgi:hypothetical protein
MFTLPHSRRTLAFIKCHRWEQKGTTEMTRQSIMASNCRNQADPVTVRENDNNHSTAKAFILQQFD